MPQKQKVSAEEKVKVIEDYINNRISLSEAARRGGVVRDTISQWARNYEADGMAAFMTCKNRVYSPELKRQAVEDYLSGMGSQAELSKKYGLRDRRQLRNWLKVYNAHGDFNSRKNSGGGSYMKQGRDTTQEERVRIVKDCLASGKNYGEMALKYKVGAVLAIRGMAANRCRQRLLLKAGEVRKNEFEVDRSVNFHHLFLLR